VLLPVAEQPDRHRAAARGDRQLVRGGGDRVVVIDEAYAEFRRAGTPSALELLAEHRNLVVTPHDEQGLRARRRRLGYLAAAPEICDALRVVRLPYHLSAVTQATAQARCGTPTSCWPRSTSCARSATARSTGCAAGARRGATATPTSCCSAGSPTGTRLAGLLDRAC
jgi:hypothetical protein